MSFSYLRLLSSVCAIKLVLFSGSSVAEDCLSEVEVKKYNTQPVCIGDGVRIGFSKKYKSPLFVLYEVSPLKPKTENSYNNLPDWYFKKPVEMRGMERYQVGLGQVRGNASLKGVKENYVFVSKQDYNNVIDKLNDYEYKQAQMRHGLISLTGIGYDFYDHDKPDYIYKILIDKNTSSSISFLAPLNSKDESRGLNSFITSIHCIKERVTMGVNFDEFERFSDIEESAAYSLKVWTSGGREHSCND